jgi:hypothetical protein
LAIALAQQSENDEGHQQHLYGRHMPQEFQNPQALHLPLQPATHEHAVQHLGQRLSLALAT